MTSTTDFVDVEVSEEVRKRFDAEKKRLKSDMMRLLIENWKRHKECGDSSLERKNASAEVAVLRPSAELNDIDNHHWQGERRTRASGTLERVRRLVLERNEVVCRRST